MALLTMSFSRRALGLIALVAALSVARGADAPTAMEVKAVFLVNLSRFVHWPQEVLPADDSPFVIGVLPQDPLYNVLVRATDGERTGTHPLQVTKVSTLAEMKACHLVYFFQAGVPEAAQTVAALREQPVLLVSDAGGFFRLGGHVVLFTQSGRMRLGIDITNLRASKLSPSANLLRVAEVTR